MRSPPQQVTRRSALILTVVGVAAHSLPVRALALPQVVINKNPSCGCCQKWAEHLVGAGFAVTVVETSKLDELKRRLGVPGDLASCHTAEIGGYVVEGHVPAAAILRLLEEKPIAIGLAVPDMPIGSRTPSWLSMMYSCGRMCSTF